MKRSKKAKALALVLTLGLTLGLTACGGSGDSANGDTEALTDLVTWEVPNREMENVFILNSEQSADLNVLCNVNQSLLETDTKGTLKEGLAEEWSTEDNGLTWTFKLRKGVKWVDVNGNEKAECTAQDFITGLEWVMNYHKNSAKNTSMPTDLIKGAGDYYKYTAELTKEEALSMDNTKFLEMVGIEAPDDYTLIYHCNYAAPYFDTVCVSACLYPVSAKFIESVGVENVLSCTNKDLWYNGAYTLTEYIQGNTKTLTKNPLYWDTECTLFDTVTIRIIEDTTVGYQLYENGEIDHIDLSESNLRTIYEAGEENEYYDQLVEKMPKKYSYQMHFNYDKRNEDGTVDTNWNTAVANEAFRQSLYYGLDLTNYWSRTNYINPLKCENNAYTMKGLLYLSDGTDYTEKVLENLGLEVNGETPARLDSDKAKTLKDQAMKELKAEGVTFPVELDYYIVSGSQNALDSATVLKQIFSESLGDDYVKLNIKTFISSQTQEVIKPRLQSFVLNGWGADYGDPQNFLGQETYGEDAAYYSNLYSNINDATDEDLINTYKEFTKLVNEANAVTDDLDKRYEAYAKAEAYMLEHALSLPVYYEVSWQLTHVNDYSKSNAMYGIQNYMYKNWETSVDAYTTEQYESIQEEYYK